MALLTHSARLAAALLLATGLGATARATADGADPRGLWLSDTRDGIIDMQSCGAGLCAHLYAILDPSVPQNATDVNNGKPGLRKRPICGLPIMGHLLPQGKASWGRGWVYDPKAGKTYDVEVNLRDPRTLVVHGYMGMKFLGKTVMWTRPGRSVQRCANHSR